MHALEGVRLVDFGQYLAGPFGPMIIGDLGADVIKVEPVTGDGMRTGRQAVLRLPAGQARHRARPQAPERAEDRARARRAGRHRAPQHDRGRREPARHRLRGLQARQPRRRLLQHLGVRARRPARALRRPRPALPGVGRARVRGGRRCTPATRRSTTASGCATPPTRCSRSSVASPRCYHQRRTGEGQELWTSLLDGGAVFASDALLVDGEAVPRPRLDQGLHGVGACYRLYETQDGWIQIAAVKESEWIALCGVLGVPELADDARFAVADLRARAPRASSKRCSRRAFATKTALVWSRALDDAGVPNEIPVDTKAGDLVLFDADNERLGLVAEYEHPIMGTHAPVRRAHPLLRDARRTSTGRRRASARTPARSSTGSATPTPRSTRSSRTTSSTGPSPTTPGRSDRTRPTASRSVPRRRSRGRGGTRRLRSAARWRSRSRPERRTGRAARRRRR